MAVISNITDNYITLLVVGWSWFLDYSLKLKGFPAFQGSEFQKNFRGCMLPDLLDVSHLRRSKSPTNIKTALRSLILCHQGPVYTIPDYFSYIPD